MADEVTPGCEIAARLANEVRKERAGEAGWSWTADEFVPGTLATDSDAFGRLCDHLHNTLNSDASDSAKLAAIREYIDPVDPWLAAMREALATFFDVEACPLTAKSYRRGALDDSVNIALSAFRAKLGDTP